MPKPNSGESKQDYLNRCMKTIPEPSGSETESEFMHRCMSDPHMNATYDQEQRAAICYRQYREKAFAGKDMLTLKGVIAKAEKLEEYKIMASTPQIDLQQDIMEPEAFKNLREWLVTAKGRILYGHSWVNFTLSAEDSLTVGKATAAEIIPDKGLLVKFIFADLPLARKLKWLVDNDFALFASVGGFVKESAEEKLSDGRKIRRIKNYHLIEMSLVTVPANEGAQFMKELKVASMATYAGSIFKELADLDKKLEGDAGGAAEGFEAQKRRAVGMADRFLQRRN